jgi:hypothetical protein
MKPLPPSHGISFTGSVRAFAGLFALLSCLVLVSVFLPFSDEQDSRPRTQDERSGPAYNISGVIPGGFTWTSTTISFTSPPGIPAKYFLRLQVL